MVAPLFDLHLAATSEKPEPMAWDALTATLHGVEHEHQHARRVVRVWHPAGPAVWHGTYGGAPVEHGDPAYRFSDGQTVTL
jgi:hypothetical protein